MTFIKHTYKVFSSPAFLFLQLLLHKKKTIDQKVDSVLKLMTLDEKIGQMNQYNGDWDATAQLRQRW